MHAPAGPFIVGRGHPQLSGLVEASCIVVCGARHGVQFPITSLDAANVPLGHCMHVTAWKGNSDGSFSA